MEKSRSRFLGQEAAVHKYDMLSVLSAAACGSVGRASTDYLRLLALITARVRWTDGKLSIGREQLAALWSIDRRSVMRQMRRYEELGYLEKTVPGARGRVTSYRVHLDRIIVAVRPFWDHVGADVVQRLIAVYETVGPQEANQVVPLPPRPHSGVTSPSPAAPQRTSQGLHALILSAGLIDEATLIQWLGRCDVEGHLYHDVQLRPPSKFIGDYISTHLLDKMQRSLEISLGRECRFRIIDNCTTRRPARSGLRGSGFLSAV